MRSGEKGRGVKRGPVGGERGRGVRSGCECAEGSAVTDRRRRACR